MRLTTAEVGELCCDSGLGIFGIGRALKDAYDSVEDAVKPYLAPITAAVVTAITATPAIGEAAGNVVGAYRAVRDIKKLNKQQQAEVVSTVSRQLWTRIVNSDIPIVARTDAKGEFIVYPTGANAWISKLKKDHSIARYQERLKAGGADPGPVIEQILIEQDKAGIEWPEVLRKAKEEDAARVASGLNQLFKGVNALAAAQGKPEPLPTVNSVAINDDGSIKVNPSASYAGPGSSAGGSGDFSKLMTWGLLATLAVVAIKRVRG